jgi:hypothetical protein
MWTRADSGVTWKLARQLAAGSAQNHTFARRPVNADADFYAFWADGDARAPSASKLYFRNRAGDVYHLPTTMEADRAKAERVVPAGGQAAVERELPADWGATIRDGRRFVGSISLPSRP